MKTAFQVRPGYEQLARVLQLALDQAQGGKGLERHADGEPFEHQRMSRIEHDMGGGFCGGQASKKLAEAYGTHNLGDVLGAINYAAGEYLYLEKRVNAELNEACRASSASNLCATEVMERELEMMEKRGMVPQDCDEEEWVIFEPIGETCVDDVETMSTEDK